jgi:hypothetical protein
LQRVDDVAGLFETLLGLGHPLLRGLPFPYPAGHVHPVDRHADDLAVRTVARIDIEVGEPLHRLAGFRPVELRAQFAQRGGHAGRVGPFQDLEDLLAERFGKQLPHRFADHLRPSRVRAVGPRRGHHPQLGTFMRDHHQRQLVEHPPHHLGIPDGTGQRVTVGHLAHPPSSPSSRHRRVPVPDLTCSTNTSGSARPP